METILGDAVIEINKIVEGEATLDKIAATMNTVVDNVNRVTHAISGIINRSGLSEKPKRQLSAFWEYVGFYIIMLLSIGAAFGYYSFKAFDWESVVTLGLVLSTAILIGAVKQMLWNQITSRNDTIESLRESIRAKDTALSASTIESSRVRMKYRKVVEYIKGKEPGFRTDILFYPKFYKPEDFVEKKKEIVYEESLKKPNPSPSPSPSPFPPIEFENKKEDEKI